MQKFKRDIQIKVQEHNEKYKGDTRMMVPDL